MEVNYQVAAGADDADSDGRATWSKWKGQVTEATETLTDTFVREGNVSSATLTAWLKIQAEDTGNQISDGYYFIPVYALAGIIGGDADSDGRQTILKLKALISSGEDDADSR